MQLFAFEQSEVTLMSLLLRPIFLNKRFRFLKSSQKNRFTVLKRVKSHYTEKAKHIYTTMIMVGCMEGVKLFKAAKSLCIFQPCILCLTKFTLSEIQILVINLTTSVLLPFVHCLSYNTQYIRKEHRKMKQVSIYGQ